MKNMKKVLFYGSLALFLGIIGYFFAASWGKNSLVINEISGSPVRVGEDNEEMDCDYVELYNPVGFSLSLQDMYLSDDKKNLQKMDLGEYTIPGKGYLLIELRDGESPFCIKASGEHIYLSCGRRVVDDVDCGETDMEKVYARAGDGAEEWEYQRPTTGKSNAGAFLSASVPSPEFSAPNGFYEEPFLLEISGKEGDKIYYTTDGSSPDESSALYTGPVKVENVSYRENRWSQVQNVVEDWKEYEPDLTPVDKIFVVRALAVDGSGNKSKESVGTFLVDMEEYQGKKVVSLVADEEDLFGEEGIYVTGKDYDKWYASGQKGDKPPTNFGKHGRDYEIPASFSFLEKGEVSTQNVGIRIQGASARKVPKKRFSVYARKEYSGSSYFEKELFPGKETHSIVLRNGFADALVSKLITRKSVAVKDAEPVAVFLNGEFWYDTFMQEKYSDSFLNQVYGVKKDDVIIAHDGEIEEGVEEDGKFYGDIYAYYSTHDFTERQGYEGFNQVLNIQSYIEYLCANIYLCNMDVSERKNFMMWRVRTPGRGNYSDGAWRMMLYDMDALEWKDTLCEAYQVDTMAEINSFREKMPTVGDTSYNSQGIYITLKQNPQYRRDFVTTFMDLVNTDFKPERVEELLNNWGEDITWNDSFFARRKDYICSFLAEEFELKGTLENVTLECEHPEGGTVRLNTFEPQLKGGSFTGEYYTDYPVTVTAKAKKGYRFEGWSGAVSSKESSIEVLPQKGGISLKATFAREEEN